MISRGGAKGAQHPRSASPVDHFKRILHQKSLWRCPSWRIHFPLTLFLRFPLKKVLTAETKPDKNRFNLLQRIHKSLFSPDGCTCRCAQVWEFSMASLRFLAQGTFYCLNGIAPPEFALHTLKRTSSLKHHQTFKIFLYGR